MPLFKDENLRFSKPQCRGRGHPLRREQGSGRFTLLSHLQVEGSLVGPPLLSTACGAETELDQNLDSRLFPTTCSELCYHVD